MMRLETRGIVTVSPRRGWFVVEPSAEESIKVYEARRIIEYGLLRNLSGVSAEGIAILADHLDEEKAAIAKGDRQRLTCLMGDFHIRIAEIAGNDIIVETLRDLTARTILISMLYQSDFHAQQSHDGHCRIFEAIKAADFMAPPNSPSAISTKSKPVSISPAGRMRSTSFAIPFHFSLFPQAPRSNSQ